MKETSFIPEGSSIHCDLAGGRSIYPPQQGRYTMNLNNNNNRNIKDGLETVQAGLRGTASTHNKETAPK